MKMRIGAFGIVLAAFVLGFAGNGGTSASAAKQVTLTPNSGFVGTVVEAKLTGANPGASLTVIFKIPGDPVLATGTTDAAGNATFTFTIPYALSGTYTIFFTDGLCACQIGVDFTVTVGLRTPTPVPTSTPIPTATPTRTATVPPTQTPAIAATATPTPRPPTPQPPVLGGGPTDTFGGPGPNVGVLAMGFLMIVTVLAWFGASQSRRPAPIAARAFEPDYTSDLDDDIWDGFGPRPVRAEASRVQPHTVGSRWLAGGAMAVAGALVLLVRRKR